MSQDADPRVRGRRVALAPGPKVETVEFFKRLHHGLHQGSVKVIPVRFFMSALIQVGPHKIVIRNAQNSAIRSKEYRFVGVVKGCHIVEPFPERAAEVAQTWFLSVLLNKAESIGVGTCPNGHGAVLMVCCFQRRCLEAVRMDIGEIRSCVNASGICLFNCTQ